MVSFDSWDWFGNSKVLGGDGTPKVVYHGTVNRFDNFGETGKRQRAFGFHFGSLSQAEYFAGFDCDGTGPSWSGGNIRPVYLRIESPLRTPDIYVRGTERVDEIVEWLIQNGVLSRSEGRHIWRARSIRQSYVRAIDAIEAAGYDGIVYENDQEGGTADINEDSYVVFWPHQIKSVFEVPGRTALLDQRLEKPSRFGVFAIDRCSQDASGEQNPISIPQ
ncbi:MAG: ADP-ribosyltransferase-containing protein [Betaproteobacteria bacterium]